jgi:hypothetical protein
MPAWVTKSMRVAYPAIGLRGERLRMSLGIPGEAGH